MEKRYFKLQLKSIFKIFPTILLITVLTFSAVGTVGVIALKNSLASQEKQVFKCGITGNDEDLFLDIGLQVIQNTEDMKFFIELEEMDEETAIKELKKGEISGYLQVPPNYIENIYSGENTPAKYITLNSPTGFGSIISDEVVLLVSGLVTESQNGMYSMQTIAKKYNKENYWDNVNTLMMTYVDKILVRHKMYKINSLDYNNNLSAGAYYICGILVMFMLLFGISSSRIFSMKNSAYGRILKMSGMSARKQVLCEYFAYLLITLITLLIFAVIFGIVLEFNTFGIPELEYMGIVNCLFFVVNIIPVIIMITMMQMAIYELIPNVVGSVLAQFIITIFLGYLSGCFYPNYFFPDIIQNLTLYLPVGSGFSYLRKTMSGDLPVMEFFVAMGYALAFFALAVKMRNNKITGDVR